jgi:hypothetical protein
MFFSELDCVGHQFGELRAPPWRVGKENAEPNLRRTLVVDPDCRREGSDSGRDTLAVWNRNPEKPIGSWKAAWGACRKLAEVEYRLHDLRHTFVSRLGVAQTADQTVMALACHMSRMMMERYRPGAKRRVDEQAVAELLGSHPDATLVELQAGLEHKTGLRVSTQHLWRVVRRLGFRLKKSRSTPKNGTRRRTASGVRSSSR